MHIFVVKSLEMALGNSATSFCDSLIYLSHFIGKLQKCSASISPIASLHTCPKDITLGNALLSLTHHCFVPGSRDASPSFVSEDWKANHFSTLPKILPQVPNSYAKEPLSSTTFSFYDSFLLSIPTPYGSWDIYSVCIDSFIEQMFDQQQTHSKLWG